MSPETVPRASVLEIIKTAAGALRAARTSPEDGPAITGALAEACGKNGVSPDAFDAALRADAELDRLKSDALREALTGRADPGPYAAISRESPSGQPGGK
jgi:hypothetical protein